MRVLFCTTGGLGHLLPLRPLADALRRRGHDIAWVTAPDAAPALQDRGFTLFAAGPAFQAGRRAFRAAHPDVVRLAGEALSAYTFPRLFGAVLGPAMRDGVEQAVRCWRPDVVVSEPAALAAPWVCRRHGLRHVTHGYGLPPPEASLAEARRRFGPPGPAARADTRPRPPLTFDITPPGLQPRAPAGAGTLFRFDAVRPARGTAGEAQASVSAGPPERASVPQPSSTRWPRIYVTFGTVFNHHPALVLATRAAARLGGLVVVTAGADGPLQALAALGPPVQAHAFVDPAMLLPHCDAVVSHGGAGSLLGAAAHGLPHLVLPQAADHFRNARALEAAGAGRAMRPDQQTEAAVASALAAMLADAALADGARALAREMGAMPDADAAAGVLERWAG